MRELVDDGYVPELLHRLLPPGPHRRALHGVRHPRLHQALLHAQRADHAAWSTWSTTPRPRRGRRGEALIARELARAAGRRARQPTCATACGACARTANGTSASEGGTAAGKDSTMQATPRGLRLHIGLFGRRNVGKSSLLNALTRQQVAIVSAVAGTTTDPVEKPMELLPLGPVRVHRHRRRRRRRRTSARCASRRRAASSTAPTWALVVAADGDWGAFEDELVAELTRAAARPSSSSGTRPTWRRRRRAGRALSARGVPAVADGRPSTGEGLDALRRRTDPPGARRLHQPARPSSATWCAPGEPVVLVMPIDKEAPKGRIILPQVQVIRDLLDHGRLVRGGQGERAGRRAGRRCGAPPGAGRHRLAGLRRRWRPTRPPTCR